LQVLQDQRFERLGGKDTVSVDVRVLAATHCDLESAIAAGRFREDLYHRLNVINVFVPPLRERTDEIIGLCRFFLAKHAPPGVEPPEISQELLDVLRAYHWPGNVRELENCMRRLLVLPDPQALANDLRLRLRPRNVIHAVAAPPAPLPQAAIPAPSATLPTVGEAQRRMEAEVILGALNKTRWNRKQAAAALAVDYKALLYKMKKLGLDEKGMPGSKGEQLAGTA
jgi:DNA-binding NtrC family response regulator